MTYTTDNATNNNTLMYTLETTCKDRNIQFTVHDNHVQCLAHVINLAVQDALSTLKVEYANNEDKILNDDNVSEVIPKVCICI